MFSGLRQFLLKPTPTRAQAAAPLRLLFALAFLGQFGVVAAAWPLLALFATPAPASSPLTAQVLLGIALLELPLGFLVAEMVARPGGKEGAMAGAIALGVVLATPAWFALFVWLSGGAARYLLLFALLIAIFCLFGVLFAGRFAARLEQGAPSATRPKARGNTHECAEGADTVIDTVVRGQKTDPDPDENADVPPSR